MSDYGTRQTDLAVKRTEWRLSRVYHQAAKDIEDKLSEWQKGHEKREQMYRQQVADGKITQEDFDAWKRGQVFQEKQWKARQEQIRQTLLNADREAARIVNDGKLDVFAKNANYVGYGLERSGNVNTGFTLYDKNTVARMIKSDPQILPKARPDVQKDKAYTYYNKLMNSAITQGIVQGESIRDIGKRVARVTGESSYKSAMRNARTAYTGAQNAGRIEGMHQAQELGIKVQKQWMATLDDKTRDTHAELDGQIRDVDEPFEVDGMEIDYPGDPTADPSLVYNCRCTLVYVYPDYPNDMERRDAETGEVVGNMTYEEWAAMKAGDGEEAEPIDTPEQARSTVVDGSDISETWQRRPDQFDFEINDVIDAQGFDGNPRVVDADEFDRAVQESGFIAQRSYSAPDQETLDAYREQLYNGDWYVDCGTGGAQYGQGMYCAADYTGTLSEGIQAEMDHYRHLGESRNVTQAREMAYENAWNEAINEANDIEKAFIRDEYFHDATLEQRRMLRRISDEELDALYDKYNPIAEIATAARDSANGVSYTETLTLMPDAKIVTWREINDIRTGTLGIEYRNEVLEEELKRRGLSGDELTFARYNAGLGVSWNEVDAAARRLGAEKRNAVMEQLEDAGNTAQRRFNEEQERRRERARIYQEKYHDIGSLAAALGYDAINAENHGQSGSYTVILNRTKVIFRRP